MKKSILISFFMLFALNYSYSQNGQLKVNNGQTLIPLNSSYWIRDYNSAPADNGVRLRMHARAGNFKAAFIDYWQQLYFRTGNPGCSIKMMINEHGMVGIGMRPWSRTVKGYNNWLQRLWVNGRVAADAYLQYSDESKKII